jgi:glyoxylase-like metal-dependent hydrolase (beta-lactamase superfamily II)
MFHIGKHRIDRVADMESVNLPTNRGFPDLPKSALEKCASEMGPRFVDPVTLDLRISFHSYVIRTNGLVILVDGCIGDDKHRKARPDWNLRKGGFLDRLAQVGVKPEDVDFVMCTHMHADHVGWNTKLVNGNWVPTFPKARYLMADIEYQHWKRRYEAEGESLNHGSFADSVLPVISSGQAEMISMSHRVNEGIYLEPAAGHTPGSVLIHIEDSSHHGVMTGDIIHHPIQLEFPTMHSKYCEDPKTSTAKRLSICNQYANTSTEILTAHFPAPSAGRIVLQEGRFGFKFHGE